MKRFIIFILLFLFTNILLSEESYNIDLKEIENQYQQLIKADPIQRKELLEKIDISIAISLLDFIRYNKIKENPENEIMLNLYDHLANLKSIDLAQKRLNKLLIVIFLTILLFSIYVSLILIKQNKIIKELKNKYEVD